MSETQTFWADFERGVAEMRERGRIQYAKRTDAERRQRKFDARARPKSIMAELEKKI